MIRCESGRAISQLPFIFQFVLTSPEGLTKTARSFSNLVLSQHSPLGSSVTLAAVHSAAKQTRLSITQKKTHLTVRHQTTGEARLMSKSAASKTHPLYMWHHNASLAYPTGELWGTWVCGLLIRRCQPNTGDPPRIQGVGEATGEYLLFSN